MSITITKDELLGDEVTLISDDNTSISQLYSLHKWVTEHKDELTHGKYVANINFYPSDSDGQGGGPVLEATFMKLLGDLGIDIYFSEWNN